MAKPMNKRLLATAILGSFLVLPMARAEQPQATAGTPALLAARLPDVDREELIDLVTTLRSRLILRKQELTQAVEDSDFEGSDAILAAILPGGLLYAGIQKARHEQARDELGLVNAEIEQYSRDILAMQPGLSPVAIVQLP
jgi:pyruvate/oxaloacetate carboxyltransferase